MCYTTLYLPHHHCHDFVGAVKMIKVNFFLFCFLTDVETGNWMLISVGLQMHTASPKSRKRRPTSSSRLQRPVSDGVPFTVVNTFNVHSRQWCKASLH